MVVEMIANDMLKQRDKDVLGQVQKNLRNIMQQYVLDEKELYQRQALQTINRVIYVPGL